MTKVVLPPAVCEEEGGALDSEPRFEMHVLPRVIKVSR